MGRILYVFESCLPVSYKKPNFHAKKIRSFCTKLIVQHCGTNVNIEKRASFCNDLVIGNNSGVGIRPQIGP